MTYLALIFGGLGTLGGTAAFVMHFLLMRQQMEALAMSEQRRQLAQVALDHAVAECTELEKSGLVLQTDINELKRELADKQTAIAELSARVTSVQKARDDLADVLKQNPGAVPAVVRSAFDRLHEEVSRAGGAQAAPAGDPGPGETSGVHAAADHRAP